MADSNLETLWCTAGEHDFTRPRVRGRKPVNCPEHKPQTTSTGGGRGPNIAAMQAGRRKAKSERDAKGIAIVLAWQEWNVREAGLFAAFNSGVLTREEYRARRTPMPETGVKTDWDAARAAGLLTGSIEDVEGMEEAA